MSALHPTQFHQGGNMYEQFLYVYSIAMQYPEAAGLILGVAFFTVLFIVKAIGYSGFQAGSSRSS